MINRPLVPLIKPVVHETEGRPKASRHSISHNIMCAVMSHYRQFYLKLSALGDGTVASVTLDLESDMQGKLAGYPIDMYGGSGKPKVTKTLRGLIRSHLGLTKQQIDSQWEGFCYKVKSLYSPDARLLVYFGDKGMIGEGLYEDDETCFRMGGENQHHKIWLACNRRAQVLVTQPIPSDFGDVTSEDMNTMISEPRRFRDSGIGRCLVWFSGNRNVWLFNPYAYRIADDINMFAEAFQSIMKWDKMKVEAHTSDHPRFGLYMNGKATSLWDDKSREFMALTPPRVTCPCGLRHNKGVGTLFCGDDCYHEFQCSGPECEECNESGDAEEWRVSSADIFLCSGCRSDLTEGCHRCGSVHWTEANELTHVNGRDEWRCDDCLGDAPVCIQCGETWHEDHVLYTMNGEPYCMGCAEERISPCTKCEEYYPNDELTNGVCSECQGEEVDSEDDTEAVA